MRSTELHLHMKTNADIKILDFKHSPSVAVNANVRRLGEYIDSATQ